MLKIIKENMNKKILQYILLKSRITSKIEYETLFIDKFPNDDTQVGECRLDTKQIILKQNQSPTEMLKTYFHECIHAASEEYKLNLTEKQVSGLEEAVYKFLRLNGWI